MAAAGDDGGHSPGSGELVARGHVAGGDGHRGTRHVQVNG
jgi:hypothetical protein